MDTAPAKAPEKLDVNKTYKTQYCIPIWLRDEQIKSASARVKGRLERITTEWRDEEISLACYGPSLKKTWEEMRDAGRPIMSGSGSHKFLLEHGVIPKWHVDVDPRPHKVELLGPPHPDVIYLPASTCCPAYFDWLEKGLGPEKFAANVKLWHIFDSVEEGQRVLPRGEWWILGGSNVGLRQLSIAAFFRFRKIHVYGMDGNFDDDGSHAGAHANSPSVKAHSTVDVNGKTFKTTQAFLECAKQTLHELNELPTEAEVTFHGEGLVQELVRNHERQAPTDGKGIVGINVDKTISEEYRELQKKLHASNLAYGVGGGKHAQTIVNLCKKMQTTSVLDYGCGKGLLQKSLPFPIWEYDPAIPGKDATARPADLVFCSDVLEHIEPDRLDAVIEDLRRCTMKMGYFIIHTGPSAKVLADGRNAHLIQKSSNWWADRLKRYFQINWIKKAGPLVHVIVSPRPMGVGVKRIVG